MNKEDVIKQLVMNGVTVDIHFSDITSKWYLSTSAEVKQGGCLISPVAHEDTLEKAIEIFCTLYKGKHVVINAYSDKRKELYIV